MIYLKLFLTFFKVGAFTFGGGYAMISIIRETVLNNGWLDDSALLDFIAVSESTPGPIAVNMATFVGSSQGGILGSVAATIGVVLPSFIIILLISSVMSKLLKYSGVKNFLLGVRPCVVGLIMATAITLFFENYVMIDDIKSFDYKAIIILGAVTVLGIVYKKVKNKKISPILLICISACFGMVLYR